ncbi:MAG: hypothetical protein ABI912_06485 [Actinomycetota bacterium]
MFKRSVTVDTAKMATAYDSAKEHLGPAYDSAKEHLGPAYDNAKEQGSHALQAAIAAMVPVVAAAAPAIAAAKTRAQARGADLLNSDAALEARERALLMLAAAKGEAVSRKRRRWPLVVAFFTFGAAIGAAATTWWRRMAEMNGASYAEDGTAGPRVDLSQPLTEADPQQVTVLPDVPTGHADSDGHVEDYSDPKATF